MPLVTLLVAGLLVLVVGSVRVFAGGESLLAGTWTLDLSKFTRPDPPLRVILTLAYVGCGKYKATVNIVDHDGAKRYDAVVFKPGGAPVPMAGMRTTASPRRPLPSRRTRVMGGGFKSHPAYPGMVALRRRSAHG